MILRKLNLRSFFKCIFFSFLISSCASQPYPYFDSSLNDNNRAPASLDVPKDAHQALEKGPQFAKQSEADFQFLKAELESSEGQSNDSIESLKSALKLDPNSATLQQKLSLEYYKQSKLTDALYWIKKSVESDPQRKDNLLLLGSMLMAKKELNQAETIYRKILKIFPEDPDAYLYLGALFSEKKDFKKSNDYFTKVIELDSYEPKYLPYYYRARSVVEFKVSRLYPKALKDLEKSFEIKPDFLEAIQVYSNIIEKTQGKKGVFQFYTHYQKKYGPIARLAEVLSQHFIEKEDYTKAFEQLEILEAMSEDVIPVKLKLALILIDQKNYKKAALKLEELNRLVPESDKVKFYLSASYDELKESQKAIQSYLQIQPQSSHYADAVIRAAFLQKSLGQDQQAFETMKKAYQAKGDNLQINLMFAQLNEDQKKYQEAIDILKLADSKFTKNSQINYFIGSLYDRLDKKDLTLKHMRLAVSYDEKNFQALNYVAYTLTELNTDLDEAEELALKAYQLQAQDAFIVDTLGWVYFKKGLYQKALTYIEKAHELSPEVSIIAEHLGDVYAKLKVIDKAQKAYLKAEKYEEDFKRRQILKNKLTQVAAETDPDQNEVSTRAPANNSEEDKSYP